MALTEQDGTLRLRLLAGPFANAADAIQLCAVLVRRGVDCRAVPSEASSSSCSEPCGRIRRTG
ncbi:MAG: hypothetical protein M5U33_03920 [Pseudorhodoplanes sp.]|nr:hypothetical protein [Pseudorhodoplanes sp.]